MKATFTRNGDHGRLENAYLTAELRLEPFFRLESLTDRRDGRMLFTGGGQLLAFDRQVIDLDAAPGIRLEALTTATPDPFYEGEGVELSFTYRLPVPGGELTLTRRLSLYDDAPAVRWFDTLSATTELAGLYYSELASGTLATAALLTAVDFFGCTDQSNRRLLESPAKGKNRASFLTGGGLFFYKEGPIPDGRAIKGDYDFTVDGKAVSLVGLGFDRLRPGEERRADGVVIGLLEDPASLTGIHRYQRARYRCDRKNEVEFLANSWPAFHQEVDAAKIALEIEAAARAGVRNLYIDDGWFAPFMGEIDRKKFPEGFAPLSRRAAELGINLGLWMNPLGLDASLPQAKEWDGAECSDTMLGGNAWNQAARTHDFRPAEFNPTKEGGYHAMDLCDERYFNHIAGRIEGFYRECGIKRFKFDLYQLTVFDTLRGDAHIHYEKYRAFLDRIKRAVPGLLISMDVTRNNRPGLDFGLDFGRLFLENRGRRLKDHRWYRPAISLGNLVNTLKYAPARKLELEVMPQLPEYPVDYVLGTAAFANPLYWGSLAELSPERLAATRSFFDRFEAHREAIADCLAYPVGEFPEEGKWNALAAIHPAGSGGYFAVYRHNAAMTEQMFALPPGFTAAERVMGEMESAVENGRLRLRSRAAFDFALYRLK